MDSSIERLKQNSAKWFLICPKEAEMLLNLPGGKLEFCKTQAGELNLRKVENEIVYFYHSSSNAREEAWEWFSSLDIYNINTIVVFGVGLGYYYYMAKDWLKARNNRRMVFIENDLEVIAKLFQTDAGTDILNDEQVLLLPLEITPEQHQQSLDIQFSSHLYPILLGNYRFSSLKLYSDIYEAQSHLLNYQLEYFKNVRIPHLQEFLSFGETFFYNFYRNLLELPRASFGDQLFNKFKGVPAIICGAGPSLNKHLPFLNDLRNKALIFAGGSAMNALTSAGVRPHFGIGIDPNMAQFSRLLNNRAFEIPYFYRNRIFPEALQTIHGKPLMVSGAGEYPVSTWVEEELGIKRVEDLDEGNNVTNFSLSIASALGCNPIILLGVDLAFTGNIPYASGIDPHPIYDLSQKLQNKGANEEVVYRNDINGQPVPTMWKWLSESQWYTGFARSHPDQVIINSTEGGIGFEGIVNMNLKAASFIFLNREFDSDALIHGEICNSAFSNKLADIGRVLKKIQNSLQKCSEYYSELIEEVHHNLIQISEDLKQLPEETEKNSSIMKKLKEEPAYKYILDKFQKSFTKFYGKDGISSLHETNLTLNKKKAYNEADYKRMLYEFLRKACEVNLKHLKNSLNELVLRESLEKKFQTVNPTSIPSSSSENKNYSANKGRIKIIDKKLELSIDEPFVSNKNISSEFGTILPPPNDNSSGKHTLYYPDGNVKLEQHYLFGSLQGPSTYYGPNGQILALSYYVKGKKEGNAKYYYPSGKLYSIQGYRNGMPEGTHEFFYENGYLKSSLPYKNGLLNGTARLFHANGTKKRELNFIEGKKTGKEFIWNTMGICELEINWYNNAPIGTCSLWYGNGSIAREVIYDKDSKQISLKTWSLEGTLLPSEYYMREDYYEAIARETKQLTSSLVFMTEQMKSLPEHIREVLKEKHIENSNLDISKDLEDLSKEMENLKSLGEKINTKTADAMTNEEEPLWKTPESQRLLGKTIEDATKGISHDLSSMENALKDMLNKLKKSIENPDTKPEE